MPEGTQSKGLAVASLILGCLSLVTFGCFGVGALVAIVLGIIAVSRAGKQPEVYGGRGLAIGGIATGAVSLVLLPIAGIIAAIAIPSLLRARISANEAAAIGDTRTVISAEMAYAASNSGYYDTLECLAAPGGCIPKYQGPPVLGAGFAAAEKNGYQRRLVLGPPASGGGDVSRSSVQGFAYIAVPIKPGQTGMRGFCGDHTGIVCFTMDGSAPGVADDGSCAQPCSLVQ
jgi:hypothetical protein